MDEPSTVVKQQSVFTHSDQMICIAMTRSKSVGGMIKGTDNSIFLQPIGFLRPDESIRNKIADNNVKIAHLWTHLGGEGIVSLSEYTPHRSQSACVLALPKFAMRQKKFMK